MAKRISVMLSFAGLVLAVSMVVMGDVPKVVFPNPPIIYNSNHPEVKKSEKDVKLQRVVAEKSARLFVQAYMDEFKKLNPTIPFPLSPTLVNDVGTYIRTQAPAAQFARPPEQSLAELRDTLNKEVVKALTPPSPSPQAVPAAAAAQPAPAPEEGSGIQALLMENYKTVGLVLLALAGLFLLFRRGH